MRHVVAVAERTASSSNWSNAAQHRVAVCKRDGASLWLAKRTFFRLVQTALPRRFFETTRPGSVRSSSCGDCDAHAVHFLDRARAPSTRCLVVGKQYYAWLNLRHACVASGSRTMRSIPRVRRQKLGVLSFDIISQPVILAASASRDPKALRRSDTQALTHAQHFHCWRRRKKETSRDSERASVRARARARARGEQRERETHDSWAAGGQHKCAVGQKQQLRPDGIRYHCAPTRSFARHCFGASPRESVVRAVRLPQRNATGQPEYG